MTSSWEQAVSTHRARYRDRIIDAAIELVAEEGVTRASMAGLAQRAGIGRATVYKYFSSVEDALLAHVEREVDACCRKLAEGLAGSPEPTRALRAYTATLLDCFASARHRLGWATLDQAELSSAAMATVRSQMARLYRPLADIFTDGVARGAFRPDLDPSLHARLILKLLMSLHEDLTSGSMSHDRAVEVVWRLLTDGLLATGAARRELPTALVNP